MSDTGNAPISLIVRSMDRPTLQRALDSVSAQTLRPRELLVVAACGAAHGQLPVVHPSIRARLVLPAEGKTRLPRPEAANTGLAAASETWIGFLDDDDELMPHHFDTLFPLATANHRDRGADGRLVYSLAQGIDASGQKTNVYGRTFTWVQFWDNTILHTMNGLFHRSLLADGCAFDESLDIHEDWDFWLQCAQHTRFRFVEEITSLWHGAEGESGCGFGSNLDDVRYRAVQEIVRAKWQPVRATKLAEIATLAQAAFDANRRGDTATAIKCCQEVLKRDPEHINAANLLGMISYRRGDLMSAAQLMQFVVTHAPPHFGIYLNMGLIEEARGNIAAAHGWFEKGLALNPAEPLLRQKLGR